MYFAYVFATFRGYLLGGVVMTGSAANLDEAADPLRRIGFAAEQTNPSCIVGDNTPTGRTVGVIGSGSSGAKGSLVRVSAKVANPLLLKRVEAHSQRRHARRAPTGP